MGATLLLPSALAALLLTGASAAYVKPGPRFGAPNVSGGDLFTAPANQTEAAFEAWQHNLTEWRTAARATLDRRIYDEPALSWASTAFVETQVMMHDRFLFDRATNSWTVERFLSDLTDRYGGVDIVMLWHSYPNIGVDDRNQFEMLESLPGGLPGLKDLVAQFHAKGVHVLLCFNPWDTGTTNAYAKQDPFERVTAAVAAVGADGFNGDQMFGVPFGFQAAARAAGMPPIVLEPEICFNNSATGVGTDVMTWSGAYAYASQPFPMTLSFKVLEQRHMVHVLHRDGKDRTRAVQTSWFNGAGVHTWENVFGIWNGLTPRVAAATKAVTAFLRALAPLVQGQNTVWTPHTPVTTKPLLFASEFRNASHALWTLVNLDNVTDATGLTLSLPCGVGFADYAWFDLWAGKEQSLTCVGGHGGGARSAVSLAVEHSGFGGLLRVNRSDVAAVAVVARLLAATRLLTRTPLSALNGSWAPLQQTLSSGQNKTAPMTKARADTVGMLAIPAAPTFNFTVGSLGVNRGEAGAKQIPEGVDVQYHGEPHPQEDHSMTMGIPPFFISKYPVTKQDYAKFLNSTKWRPAVAQNWLRDWSTPKGNGAPVYQDGQGRLPVVWVSRADAVEYCASQGARLPHEWEWQYAAQGNDGRPWPWGAVGDNDTWGYTHRPNVSHAMTMPPPTAVDAYPSGASPLGVEAMVSGVREWTDVYTDAHMSRAVLRGGSYWSPLPQPAVVGRYFFNHSTDIGYTDGAPNWYYPNPLEPIEIGAANVNPAATPLTHHTTLLMQSDSMDRSGGIGFRCAADW